MNMTTRKFLSNLIPALPMLLTALLVILVTVIFLTAMRSKAHAQFGGVEQPMFQLTSSAGFVMPSATNIFIDLDDSDLALGNITTWTSRVTKVSFTNFASNKAPIKESEGARFYGTNSMKMEYTGGLPLYASNAHFVVYRSLSGSPTAWKTVFGSSAAERLIGPRPRKWTINLVAGIVNELTSDLSTNVYVDVIYTGGQNPTTWTNGVFSSSVSPTLSDSWSWNVIGGNQGLGVADPWIGYLRKMVWWTNTVSLTTNDVISLHHWATNEYNYSP